MRDMNFLDAPRMYDAFIDFFRLVQNWTNTQGVIAN